MITSVLNKDLFQECEWNAWYRVTNRNTNIDAHTQVHLIKHAHLNTAIICTYTGICGKNCHKQFVKIYIYLYIQRLPKTMAAHKAITSQFEMTIKQWKACLFLWFLKNFTCHLIYFVKLLFRFRHHLEILINIHYNAQIYTANVFKSGTKIILVGVEHLSMRPQSPELNIIKALLGSKEKK